MTDHDQIKQLEEELRLAMLSSDIAQLDKLISGDLIFTDQSGNILTKDMDLDTHRSGRLVIDELLPAEQQIKLFDDTAIVSVLMSVEGSYAGQRFNIRNRYTRVWIRRNDQWTIVAAHSVSVPG